MGQPAAIGRFGVGFNAVYHLTDLPSFVSGSSLVLFDPRACGAQRRLFHDACAWPLAV